MSAPVHTPREDEADPLESYEQLVDHQLADEAREAEDEGSHGFLAEFID